jgi:hypothetical protein
VGIGVSHLQRTNKNRFFQANNARGNGPLGGFSSSLSVFSLFLLQGKMERFLELLQKKTSAEGVQ